MGYDDHNRLTSYGSCRSYTYDAWNNLLSVSSSNGVGEAPNYTLTYATNASGAPATNRINNSATPMTTQATSPTMEASLTPMTRRVA